MKKKMTKGKAGGDKSKSKGGFVPFGKGKAPAKGKKK